MSAEGVSNFIFAGVRDHGTAAKQHSQKTCFLKPL